jgi:hypothetical protein
MEGLEHFVVFFTSKFCQKIRIFVSKMDDAGVKTIFEKETCRMVRGEMVLLRGFRFGTLYKLQGVSMVN